MVSAPPYGTMGIHQVSALHPFLVSYLDDVVDASIISTQCTGISVSTLSSQSTRKHKRSENLALSTEEPRHKKHWPCLDRSFRKVDGPRVGRRPVFDVSIHLLHLNKVIKTKALMDTGATTFCLSDRLVNLYSVPKVQ